MTFLLFSYVTLYMVTYVIAYTYDLCLHYVSSCHLQAIIISIHSCL